MGDSLNVLEVNEVNYYREALEKINPEDYGVTKKSLREKIEWICDNFEITCDELVKKE
ncbi:MAG: hypothetical protein LBB45_02975 [Methanobrevibacter sp.]|nr:hypothetical protein [Candidatus Methanovirga basalitermitum]